MKYFTLILILLVIPLIFSGCGGIELQSFWIKTDIKIDGNTVDWFEVPIHTFKNHAATLGVCNNKENLYLLFRFTNPEWLRVASDRGFVIWFDPSGEREKNLGLRYLNRPPYKLKESSDKPVIIEDYWGGWQPKQGLEPEAKERLLLLRNPEKPGKQIRTDGMDGPQVKLGHYEGIFIYELILPFKLLKPVPNVTDTLPHVPYELDICLEFGGLNEASLAKLKQQMQDTHEPVIDPKPIGELGQGGAIGNWGGKINKDGVRGAKRGTRGRTSGFPDDRERIWITVVLADRPIVRLNTPYR